ncbi:MAG: HAD family hydrolase [Oscillospiraceae bacterium]|nr:HAD family hydrolase [Oscillospiraceae bacterium]
MKNTVIFDLDGTLLDTLDDLTDSVNYALDKSGMPLRTKDEIRRFVGNGVRVLIKRAVPEGTDDSAYEVCFKDFREYYVAHMEDKTAPYDGVCELLRDLKNEGFKTAIVTNKADFAAQDLCRRMFGKNIDAIVGSVDGRPNKPAPDGVFYALELLDESAENALFVGDSDVDIQTAQNASIEPIGVLWGFRDKEIIEKAGAKHFASTAKELKTLLLSLKNV